MKIYKSAVDYLVAEKGVSRVEVETLEEAGFIHTTMICPDVFEQIAYERMLIQQFGSGSIKIVPLRGGGRAYWVRDGMARIRGMGKDELSS